jgi:hypothetical protein
MKRFAVTVFVEADDTLGAIVAAQDYLISASFSELNAETCADDGAVKVRPARKGEGPQTSAPTQETA